MAVKPSSVPIEVQSDKLDLVRQFADQNDRFNDTFLSSLEKDFEGYGYLTENQMHALENIIYKWNIEEWFERNFA